jgi:hypothetical protein
LVTRLLFVDKADTKQLPTVNEPGPQDPQESLFDISETHIDGPTQPVLLSYKKTTVASKARSFASHWYSRYPTIEYSVSRDAVFCFVCRHFPPKSENADHQFVQTGCRNWKKLGDKLQKHVEAGSHLEAVAQWSAAKDADATGTVLNKVNSHHKQNVVRNRQVVATLIRAVLFCARQCIALRGHRESGDKDNVNRGNFVELCNLLETENPELASKLRAMPANASYMSNTAQDDFLQAAATVLRQQIIQEVSEAEMFALIVDEARDNSCTEQMSLCIRYVLDTTGVIVERFLGFMPLEQLSAESLTGTITQFLAGVGLSIKQCIAQSYDGASVMSGVKNGVQKLIRDATDNPCPYVHCHAHRLNLVLADVAKRVDIVANTVGLLEAIYTFQSVSTIRHRVFIQSQKDEVNLLSIPQQSDTRWVCKYAGVRYFFSRFGCVIAGLSELMESRNKKEAAEARGLLQQFRSFDIVFALSFLHDLLGITQSLSLQLQSSTLDFGHCRRLIDACLKTVKEKRDDIYFDRIWKEASQKATDNGIEPLPSAHSQKSTKRNRLPPATLSAYITETTTGNHSVDEIEVQTVYRGKLFAVVDELVAELEHRFVHNDELLHAVAACDPQSSSFMSPDSLLVIADQYTRLKVGHYSFITYSTSFSCGIVLR